MFLSVEKEEKQFEQAREAERLRREAREKMSVGINIILK